jgi:hypothetical protein
VAINHFLDRILTNKGLFSGVAQQKTPKKLQSPSKTEACSVDPSDVSKTLLTKLSFGEKLTRNDFKRSVLGNSNFMP